MDWRYSPTTSAVPLVQKYWYLEQSLTKRCLSWRGLSITLHAFRFRPRFWLEVGGRARICHKSRFAGTLIRAPSTTRIHLRRAEINHPLPGSFPRHIGLNRAYARNRILMESPCTGISHAHDIQGPRRFPADVATASLMKHRRDNDVTANLSLVRRTTVRRNVSSRGRRNYNDQGAPRHAEPLLSPNRASSDRPIRQRLSRSAASVNCTSFVAPKGHLSSLFIFAVLITGERRNGASSAPWRGELTVRACVCVCAWVRVWACLYRIATGTFKLVLR